jgi:hypothetical protein
MCKRRQESDEKRAEDNDEPVFILLLFLLTPDL